MAEKLDTLIVGAGPAGLTAALYLARFRRKVLVADTGVSRARWIPTSRNLPSYAQGLHGETLLARLREQAASYDVEVQSVRVDHVERRGRGFQASVGDETVQTATMILATGVVERVPPIPGAEEAITRGLMRVCPICDGFETRGRRVAVLGADDHAVGEALFLRTWAADVSLVLTRDAVLSPERRAALTRLDVRVFHAALESISLGEDDVTAVCTEGGRANHFDLIYAAFGVTPQTTLARALGAKLDESGRLVTGEHQETSVDALYAAGDVVRGLNQISVAEGEAAIAATAIHNRLPRNPAERGPSTLSSTEDAMPKETKAKQKTVERVMHEFKQGELESGPDGKAGKVKSRKQAVAIALSAAGASSQKTPKQNAKARCTTKAKEG